MAEMKTQPNDRDIEQFLVEIPDEKKRRDSRAILGIMKEATGEEPQMWGDSIIGFGNYHYRYESGREGDSFLAGFAPRKRNLTLYIMSGFDAYEDLLGGLGKYKTGKAFLYINKLEDVDRDTLKELVRQSARHIAETNA